MLLWFPCYFQPFIYFQLLNVFFRWVWDLQRLLIHRCGGPPSLTREGKGRNRLFILYHHNFDDIGLWKHWIYWLLRVFWQNYGCRIPSLREGRGTACGGWVCVFQRKTSPFSAIKSFVHLTDKSKFETESLMRQPPFGFRSTGRSTESVASLSPGSYPPHAGSALYDNIIYYFQKKCNINLTSLFISFIIKRRRFKWISVFFGSS